MKYTVLLALTFVIFNNCRSIKSNRKQESAVQNLLVLNDKNKQITLTPCHCSGEGYDSLILCANEYLQSSAEKVCNLTCFYDGNLKEYAFQKAIEGNSVATKIVSAIYICGFKKWENNGGFLKIYPKELFNLRGENAFLAQMKYFSIGTNVESGDMAITMPFFLMNKHLHEIIKSIDGVPFTQFSNTPKYDIYKFDPYLPVNKVNDPTDSGRAAGHKALMEYYKEGKIEFWEYGEREKINK